MTFARWTLGAAMIVSMTACGQKTEAVAPDAADLEADSSAARHVAYEVVRPALCLGEAFPQDAIVAVRGPQDLERLRGLYDTQGHCLPAELDGIDFSKKSLVLTQVHAQGCLHDLDHELRATQGALSLRVASRTYGTCESQHTVPVTLLVDALPTDTALAIETKPERKTLQEAVMDLGYELTLTEMSPTLGCLPAPTQGTRTIRTQFDFEDLLKTGSGECQPTLEVDFGTQALVYAPLPASECVVEKQRLSQIGSDQIDVRFEMLVKQGCDTKTQPSWTLVGTVDPGLPISLEVVSRSMDELK